MGDTHDVDSGVSITNSFQAKWAMSANEIFLKVASVGAFPWRCTVERCQKRGGAIDNGSLDYPPALTVEVIKGPMHSFRMTTFASPK